MVSDAQKAAGGCGLCVIVSIVIFVIVTIFWSARTVEAGHVGVVKRFGAVKPKPLKEGLNWVTPWITTVEEIDTRITHVEQRAEASSKDLQVVEAEVSIQYYLNGGIAPQIFQRIGHRDNVEIAVIVPAIQESVKAVIAKYTAEELVTKRDAIKKQIQMQVKEFIDNTLKTKELQGSVKISNVAMTDFQFSAEFNRAIEMKVRAEQEALQAVNEKNRTITQAQAAREEKQIAAQAEAFRITQQAAARAEAITKEAEALKDNPELIRLRLAEKWNGVLPMFGGGQGQGMILDVSGLMNGKTSRGRRALEYLELGDAKRND